MPLDLVGGPHGPGTQIPGADVSEEGITGLFRSISEVKKKKKCYFVLDG